ncbi:MAG: hypothetical protein R3B84_01885 [Zavarzinella sp.]
MNDQLCKIVKRTASGVHSQLSHLPAEVVKVGRTVKIQSPCGCWDDEWVIHEIYHGNEPAHLETDFVGSSTTICC